MPLFLFWHHGVHDFCSQSNICDKTWNNSVNQPFQYKGLTLVQKDVYKKTYCNKGNIIVW